MVQSPSWEANWFAANQEIPRISRNPKVHYRTHKRPPLETLPPGDPSGVVVYLQIVLSPEQASRMRVFLNRVFYREGLLTPRPTPKLEDHPSSAARDCLLNLFAAALLIGCRSSIRNLRTRQKLTWITLNTYCWGTHTFTRKEKL